MFDKPTLRTFEIASHMRIPDYRPSCLCVFIRQINKQRCLYTDTLLICLTDLFLHLEHFLFLED